MPLPMKRTNITFMTNWRNILKKRIGNKIY